MPPTAPIVLTQPYEVSLHKRSRVARFCVRAVNLIGPPGSSSVTGLGSSWRLLHQDRADLAKGVIFVIAQCSGPIRDAPPEVDNITITVTNTDGTGSSTPGSSAPLPVYVDDNP